MTIGRREFVKKCGATCLQLVGLAVLMEACKPLHQISARPDQGKIVVPRSELVAKDKKHRKSILVRVTELPAPILVNETATGEYSALLLQCSHQGAELSVNGNILTCPAHGSEFDKVGAVIQGPAEQSLLRYRVSSDNTNIYIHLT